MNEDQISRIVEAALVVDQPTRLCWEGPDGRMRIVVSIGEPPKEEVPEPSLVAYLEGGGFVALWNADFKDFYFITSVSS